MKKIVMLMMLCCLYESFMLLSLEARSTGVDFTLDS